MQSTTTQQIGLTLPSRADRKLSATSDRTLGVTDHFSGTQGRHVIMRPQLPLIMKTTRGAAEKRHGMGALTRVRTIMTTLKGDHRKAPAPLW